MAVDRSTLPAVGGDPTFVFPRITRGRLSNELTLRSVGHRTVPVVSLVFQCSGGSASDPAGAEGLAAITADMLDEGIGSLSAIEVSDALARIGAEFDIDVGADATVITMTTLRRYADRAAALLADMVARPSLREEDFERVRQLRLDRLRQLRDLPPALAERAFLRLLYGSHPYGHLSIGTDAALRALSIDDVRRHHRTMWRPDASALVIVGDLSSSEMEALAERAFGSWVGKGDPPVHSAIGEIPAHVTPRIAVVPRERAAQSHLRIGHLSAPRNSPDYPALAVMNAVLGGQFVSRINLKLRQEKGYTYGARTGFDWRRGSSPFSLEASVDTRATADAIRDSLAELGAIGSVRPADAQELSLAKASLTRGYPRNFETSQQVARSVSQLLVHDLPDSYFEEYVPRIHAVTAADVTRAARRYLDPSRLTTLIVGDHQAVADSLSELALGDPVILGPEG